jgi:glucose-1-phosphate thymidylyltransferase
MEGAERPGVGALVGIVPAAGRGTRLAGRSGSKEILPVGFEVVGGARRPRPVCTYLLEAMALAGVARALVVLRPGKEDIPKALGDGGGRLPPLSYLTIEPTASVPETVDRALAAVADAEIAFGFPDILFEPRDALARLVERRRSTGGDLALGLFPTDRPEKADLVELDPAGRIRRILVKPGAGAGDLRLTWILAAWTPVFGRFLHDFLAQRSDSAARREGEPAGARELYLSDVIQAAIDRGLRVEALPFPAGSYLDVGTPDDLARASRGQIEAGYERAAQSGPSG